jgi:hypothetical protein
MGTEEEGSVTHKDITGAPIKVGAYIVYAALWDRSATLKFGRVVALAEAKRQEYDSRERLPLKVQCVTVDRDGPGKWYVQGRDRYSIEEESRGGKAAKSTLVTLGFLDRMMVVSAWQLPANVRKLLDDAAKRRSA